MTDRITKFNVALHDRIKDIQHRLEGLKHETKEEIGDAQRAIHDHIESLEGRVKEGRTKLKGAKDEIKDWVDETKSTVNEWKDKHEIDKLHARSEGADRYADSALDVALGALEEAEKAMLQSWLARADFERATDAKNTA